MSQANDTILKKKMQASHEKKDSSVRQDVSVNLS